ncbi:MAG: macro domain-containing protein [Acidobacteriota bacterium]
MPENYREKMRVVLADIETAITDAYERFCGDLDFVEIHRDSILKVSCDAVVSPANSFGFMDGGIDMVYSHYFGGKVQERLQNLIKTKHYGELIVGSAEIVETDNQHIPILIAAPTMRVPMSLKNTINPYLAARAVFLLIKNGVLTQGTFTGEPISNVIKTVAFPGLGTGVGGVGPNTCAKQMRVAIDDIVLEKYSFPFSWVDAQERHQRLYRDWVKDLQHEE